MAVFMYKMIQFIFMLLMINQCSAEVVFRSVGVRVLFTADQNYLRV